MTYPKTGGIVENEAFLSAAKQKAIAAGLDPRIISNGGSPDMWRAHEVTSATEHRPGTYIYMDRFQVAKGVGTWDDCGAYSPHDGGQPPHGESALSMPVLKRLPAIPSEWMVRVYCWLSGCSDYLAQRGTWRDRISACEEKPGIGDRLRIIPNHACVVRTCSIRSCWFQATKW